MRNKGAKASPMSKKIKDKFGMTLKGYAEQNGISYSMLTQLTSGSNGKIFGPNGIGVFGKIANKLKEDGVWIEPDWEDK